ncbi:hypothetical protein CIC12_21765 [Burkholderia sp. SG-MS1]|nr:hypothetical protein [Paraburkholderia sp. SG-MS1]
MSGYLHFEQCAPIVLLTIYTHGTSADDSTRLGCSFATSCTHDIAPPDLEPGVLRKPTRRSLAARFVAWLRPLTMLCSAES